MVTQSFVKEHFDASDASILPYQTTIRDPISKIDMWQTGYHVRMRDTLTISSCFFGLTKPLQDRINVMTFEAAVKIPAFSGV